MTTQSSDPTAGGYDTNAPGWMHRGFATLRPALRLHLDSSRVDAGISLRPGIQTIANDCRKAGAEPTTLVVEFKNAWHTLPEVNRLPRRDSQELLDKAVSLLIEEYYNC